ncbi:MAG: hypothetical protein AAFR66_22115, partial [Bacteroidota bacterium]
MKHLSILFLTFFIMLSCDNTSELREAENEISLLPHSKEIQLQQKEVVMSTASKLFSPNEEAYPLLELLREELAILTTFKPEITPTHSQEVDVVLEIDPELANEEFHIDIQEVVHVRGGSYQALA